MRQGRIILLELTAIFILTEVFFNFIVLTNGDGDLFGATSKTILFLLLIFLFSKKLTWAKWILSVSLILYGLLCLLVGFELMATFYLIGLYYILFGVYIHKSKALQVFRKDSSKDTSRSEPKKNNDTIAIHQEYLYPRLVRRYKALLIDGLLMLFVLIIIMIIVNDSEMRTTIMMTSALIISATYEPILTAYSRTIGQRLMRIRVGKHENPLEKINLLNAYIRCFTKGLLGWISFITINFNPEHRAIHDMASGSVMIDEK
jgi:uncharacterized RDD family membrane protein YckC